MALKTVKYVTTTKIACATAFPADVALCITQSKVAPHEYSNGDVQNWDYDYIDAILTDVEKACNSCYYTYTFSYDEALIASGELLYATDILGIICKDCETSYLLNSIAGDAVFKSLGMGLELNEGSNAGMGQATLVAGTVTVANTKVTANSRIFLSREQIGGTAGNLDYTIVAGVSFTINSDNAADTSSINWLLIESV